MMQSDINDLSYSIQQYRLQNRKLRRYIRNLNKEFDAVIESRRWRVGNFIIRSAEILLGRSKRRLSTDSIVDIFRDYHNYIVPENSIEEADGFRLTIKGDQLEKWMTLLKHDFNELLLSNRWKVGGIADFFVGIFNAKGSAKIFAEKMRSTFEVYGNWKRGQPQKTHPLVISDKDIRQLTAWMTALNGYFTILMTSSRWKFGSAVGRFMDRVLRRPCVPLVTDHMSDIFGYFDSLTSRDGSKSTDSAPWSYRISESELYQRVRWYNYQKPRRKANVVVYTAIMGSYDPLLLPETIIGDWDYVVFCDTDIPGEHIFEVRQPNFRHNDPAKVARYVKTNPHRYFPDYDYAVWVDSNILIRGSHLTSSVSDCQQREVPIMFNPHPDRSCVYEEIKMCIKRGKDNRDVMEKQVARYKTEGFPEHYGMFETGILIRRHNSPLVKAFGEAWWREIEKGSRRDQLSVTYVIWKQKLPFEKLQGMKNVRIHEGNDYCLFRHGGQWQSGIPPYSPPSFVRIKEEQALTQTSQIEDDLLLERIIEYHRAKKEKPRKVVVYTAISNNYDVLKIPETLCPDWDYVCFTDRYDLLGDHPWEIRHFDNLHEDPTRTSRYLKTHPHVYFSEYEYSIWIDAHLLIKSNFLEEYTNTLMSKSGVFAAIPHPFRNCTYQEGELCITENKDDAIVITEQLRRYRQEGLPEDWGLIESGVLIRKHNDSQMRSVNEAWWSEIEKDSKRDQLSLMYILWKNCLAWKPMMPKGVSTRNHPGFSFFQHGLTQTHRDPRYFIPAFLPPDFGFDRRPYWVGNETSQDSDTLNRFFHHHIDIIICVHNAIEDVSRCLDSVLSNLLPEHRLIIVDDGSDNETQKCLRTKTHGKRNVSILRHDTALGYTKSANAGMAACEAPFVILLNSDTIVSRAWSLKLLQTAMSGHDVGIVGPMSNAASWQSLPLLRDPVRGGMAVNDLPEGMDVTDMDQLCEQYGWFLSFPRVPLVNGFCYGIKREVIEAIGRFDDEAFPMGYGEEDDFSMRALNAGFVHAIATHCYVYHAKSKSFGKGGRKKLAETGGRVLRTRHGAARIQRAVTTTQNNPLLMKVRTEVGESCGFKASEQCQRLLPLTPGADDPVVYTNQAHPAGNKRYDLNQLVRIDPNVFPPELTLGDISAEELDANDAFVKQMRRRSIGEPRSVIWFLPNFRNILAGGVRTIFQVAENFSRVWQTNNHFVICRTTSNDIEYDLKEIQKLFPDLCFTMELMHKDQSTLELPTTDIAFCSSWPTAYLLTRYNQCKAKFYFMQDYESLFYPAGSVQGLIEQTYHFGFYCIANSPGIAEKYRQFSEDVAFFVPGVDKGVYKPNSDKKKGPPWQVVFYGRPHNNRNAFALGMEALKIVKTQLGENVRIISVGSNWEPEAYGVEGIVENYGILGSLEAVAQLYQDSHVGLVTMLTPHPSYQPLEYMASGCVTVTNRNTGTDWLFKDGVNAVLTSVIPADTARGITNVLTDSRLKERIIAGGLDTVKRMNWDDSFDHIRTYVSNPNGD